MFISNIFYYKMASKSDERLKGLNINPHFVMTTITFSDFTRRVERVLLGRENYFRGETTLRSKIEKQCKVDESSY